MKRYIEVIQEARVYRPEQEQTTIIGASVQFYYKDDPSKIEYGYFSFGAYCEITNEDGYGVCDDLIYFYCEGQAYLDRYMLESNQEFVVVSYQLERGEVGLQNTFQLQ